MLRRTDDNLYVGTSASEILHLVCLPPEKEFDPPQYILATRLQPSGHDAASNTPSPGVQQILVLPGPNKAVVLCNGTASFYSLPELSPAFPNREPTGVLWIGGYDENVGRDASDGTTVMIATSRNINQVRVGDKLRPIKPAIPVPQCLEARRRDTIACVADSKSYALLEIEHQQKIPLFEISTAPDPPEAPNDLLAPPASSHGRSKSLGHVSPSLIPTERSQSPAQSDGADGQAGSRRRSSTTETSPTAAAPRLVPPKLLKPHVLSPFPNEFMLTTGTAQTEPGVGMFVNLDGDVSRGTIEFDLYPDALLAYSFSQRGASPEEGENPSIIALLEKPQGDQSVRGLEIQSLTDNGTSTPAKAWLVFPTAAGSVRNDHAGLHQCLSVQRHVFTEVADLLQAVRYRPSNETQPEQLSYANQQVSNHDPEQESSPLGTGLRRSGSPNLEYEQKRMAEELAFVRRLGHSSTRAMTWTADELWHILQNPLLLQLESAILRAFPTTDQSVDFTKVNVSVILSFLGSIRDREPQDETEFLSIKYARQKASVVLFLHLLTGLNQNANLKAACKIAESALQEGEIDPRIPLSLLPPLSREVILGSTGIWLHQGIVDCLVEFAPPLTTFSDVPKEFWLMLRHFLSTWQEKRGFGSISDEQAVFDTVDAALLHLLLHLDSVLTKGDGAQAPTRAKLNNVVDHWKGDFDRAVALLEHYKRLYILSRLYQSRKSAKDVLQTWRRICDGEENADREVSSDSVLGHMRRYLSIIRDSALVQQYAIWMAQRSPHLAIQVLSDDESRVKFAPAEVVTLLKANAPGAVQLFLEHLVFAKNLDQYADDLVGYYLDSVLSVLEDSDQARQSLADSYSTYRALTSPKPTYLNFIRENAPDEPWWQSRLRLLQLLGTGAYANPSGSSKTLTYSIDMVLSRLKPFSTYLVSESIILDARQGRHDEALKLLVHGLGDYDTAVRYCYFGGPTSPSGTIDVSMLPARQQQQEHFRFLFTEFLQIEDVEERTDRTSHLLGTFATWFDPLTILNSIPDSWSVSLLSEFLLRTFRAATTERNQAVIIKALSAAQNLQKQAEFIETCEKIGAKLEVGNDAPHVQSDNDITIT